MASATAGRSDLHVLIVSAWDPTSGVLTVYRSLARHLRQRGVRFSAFAFDGWREDTLWTFCDELIDGRATTLAQVLISGRYDVVHAVNTTYAAPWGIEKWSRRARFRGPVILMAQSLGGLTASTNATSYVACSHAAANALSPYAARPVQVIPNGYDEVTFTPAPVEGWPRPTLVWVGRSYDDVKDVGLFLSAVESLPSYDAVIVDDDPSGAVVRDRLTQLGPRTVHLSHQSPRQMARTFRRAAASNGALVSTSRHEGFNIAAVEAMACNCPVVVPRVPGFEHLVDGENAITYDRGSGATAVVQAVRRLDDRALRERVVANARRQAEAEWTSERMAEAYFDLYRRALASTQPARLERVADPVARSVWRAALRGRPYWHRVRARVHG